MSVWCGEVMQLSSDCGPVTMATKCYHICSLCSSELSTYSCIVAHAAGLLCGGHIIQQKRFAGMQAPTAPLGRGMTGRAQTTLVRHPCMHMRRLLIRALSRDSMGELASSDGLTCLDMEHLAL